MSKVWVTRDKEEGFTYVEIWKDAPEKRAWGGSAKGEFYYDGPQATGIAVGDFKATFGFTPPKGSCKQYKLSLKEIK